MTVTLTKLEINSLIKTHKEEGSFFNSLVEMQKIKLKELLNQENIDKQQEFVAKRDLHFDRANALINLRDSQVLKESV